jgi:hypothetical protein
MAYLEKRSGPFTSHATPGTRSTHAHGLTSSSNLGRSRVPKYVMAVPTATDADGALTEGTVRVVKWDKTNVTVRATAASVPFDLVAVY